MWYLLDDAWYHYFFQQGKLNDVIAKINTNYWLVIDKIQGKRDPSRALLYFSAALRFYDCSSLYFRRYDIGRGWWRRYTSQDNNWNTEYMYRWLHRTKIMEQMHLSHHQLRRITAKIVDKELLHYIEARRIYITTDQGYIFLKKGE
jgi:hypothetical protein